MPVGFQTLNEDGSIEVDYTTRLGGLVAAIYTDSTHGGSVATVLIPDGEFFYFIVPPPGFEGRQPVLTYGGGRIYWHADVTGNGLPAYPLVPCMAFVGWC